MGNNIQQPVSKEETITVYAAPGSEHCEEPPTQVVRANPTQLVVTDRPAGQSSIFFQSVKVNSCCPQIIC